MDLLILGVCLMMQVFLTVLGVGRKAVYALFFATLTGALMTASLAADGGTITYYTSATLITVAPNAFVLVILALPTFFDAFALLALKVGRR